MEAICRNCRQIGSLQRSHAIPNSFFKTLARGENGRFIELNDGPSKARFSQDSGRDFLLCSACENLFGRVFDGPLVEEIRTIRAAYREKRGIVTSNFKSIKSSIASIIWRASISSAYIYKGFKVPRSLFHELEIELWCKDENLRRFSYSLQPIFDPNHKDEGGFGDGALESLILTPKPWRVMHGFSGRAQNGWGVIFVMGGVVVTMLQPRLSAYKERQNSYLLSNGYASRLRPINMWSIPYLREFLTYAVHKERNSHIEILS